MLSGPREGRRTAIFARGRIAIAPLDSRLDSPRPSEQAQELWAEGRLHLRLISPDGGETVALVDRPFAVIGREPTVDLPVPSPAASLRHVYLHVDGRGVFAVDLASRNGTRFDGAPPKARASWLCPGRGLELVGYRVELIDVATGPGQRSTGGGLPLPEANPLAEVTGLAPLELVAQGEPGRPLRLLSELSFLGRGQGCAVRAEGGEVARVHAVIVRSIKAAFVVDLVGRALTINGEPPPGPASPLRDGDLLGLGRSRFAVRLGPAWRAPTTTSLAVPAPRAELSELLASRALQAVREGHEELLRTNDQFQRALVSAVRQLYEEQAALFDRHLERLDRLQHEVAELREELRRRLAPGAALPGPSAHLGAPVPPSPSPGEVLHPPGPADSGHATSWLLDRLGELEEQLDRESRSGWRDLFSRAGSPLRTRGNT